MTKKYYVIEGLNTRQPFTRYIDDNYNYSYVNTNADDVSGCYFEISESKAKRLERLKHFINND